MAVDRDDAVGVLVHDGALRVHAEGPHEILILLGLVDDLALIDLIRDVAEDLGRELHAHADVHAVREGLYVQVLADLLHPFAAAAADGNDALFAGKFAVVGDHRIAALYDLHLFYGREEEDLHLVLQFIVEVREHLVVDVRAQVPDGGIEQVQPVLQAFSLQPGGGGGIELGLCAAMGSIDRVHVFHQFDRLVLADELVERAAEGVGNVVFPIREGAGAAEARHDGTVFAVDAFGDLFAVDGAFALFQRIARLEDGDLHVRPEPGELIGREDPAGAGADNYHIVIHSFLRSL